MAPALTPRCELVKAPGDREYCDIASSSAESPCTGSLCVLKPLARLAPVRRPGAVPGPSRSVSQQVLQNLKIQCLVGHDPLRSVLLFDLLQASRLVGLRAPSIVRRLSDPVPAAYLTDRRSSVHFLGWSAAAVFAVTFGWSLLRPEPPAPPEPPGPVTRVSVLIGDARSIHPGRAELDLSTDGSLMVSRGLSDDGGPQLWLRRWDALEATPIRNTESLSANLGETRNEQRIRVGRRQRNRGC